MPNVNEALNWLNEMVRVEDWALVNLAEIRAAADVPDHLSDDEAMDYLADNARCGSDGWNSRTDEELLLVYALVGPNND